MARTVAVVGASTSRRKFGNKALRAFRQQGYTVLPIHPRADTVEGERAYRSVLDAPQPIDMVAMYVPPEIGIRILEEVAQIGRPELWLNPGSGSAALVARARALGLEPIEACAIMAIGESPGRF